MSDKAAPHAPATEDYEAGARALADYIGGLRQVHMREKDEFGLQELPAQQGSLSYNSLCL